MGNKTKAARARLVNLSKASAKIYKPTVEDCSDTDDLDYTPDLDTLSSDGDDRLHEEEPSQEPGDCHFAFDKGQSLACLPEEDSESEGSEFDEADIMDGAASLTFVNVLQLTQEAGLAAERKANQSKKCRKCYKGNSERSLHQFRVNRKAIAAMGKQGFISPWLTASMPALLSVSQNILNFDRLSSPQTRRYLRGPLKTCVKKKRNQRMKHREMKNQVMAPLLHRMKTTRNQRRLRLSR